MRKKASIKNPLTGWYLEVDVWYADLKLCFEYQVFSFVLLPLSFSLLTFLSQDEHHYQPSWYSQIPLDVLQQKDGINNQLSKKKIRIEIEIEIQK